MIEYIIFTLIGSSIPSGSGMPGPGPLDLLIGWMFLVFFLGFALWFLGEFIHDILDQLQDDD